MAVNSKGFPFEIPFLDWLDLRMHEAEIGHSHFSLVMRPHHLNSYGMAHGGLVLTMLDISLAMAARSLEVPVRGPDMPGMLTVELKTSFMRPTYGETIRAEGHCLHRTRTLAFCEGEVYDGEGKVAARASGTFKYPSLRKEDK